MRSLLAALLFITAVAAPGPAAARPPLLVIASPADVSDLGPSVEVQGRVADPAATLSWSIPGTGLRGEAPVAPDGTFAFKVETDGLHLTQSLRLVARDRVGRSEERVLLLVDQDPGPVLSLDDLAESSAQASGAAITGRVADPAGGRVAGWLESLGWSVLRPAKGGSIAVGDDGEFSLVLGDEVPEGDVLWLRAEDRFGHLTLMAVPLLRRRVATTGAATTGAAATTEPAPQTFPSPVPTAADSSIEILSPVGVGWYRSRLTVEGRISASGQPVESLAWKVSGDRGPSGELLVDSDGTFRLELATRDLTGDRCLSLAGETPDGRQVETLVELRDGRLLPEVRIDSPRANGSYGAQLRLAGLLIDPYAGVAGMEGFESVSWEIAPFGASSEGIRSGPIAVGADGTFEVAVSTRGITGQQLLSVLAVGRSGNRSRAGVRVARGESDFPSFSAAAGDGAVTLRWDAQRGGTRSDILYAQQAIAADGSGASLVENVQPPFELRDLVNGTRYFVRLRARTAGEPDAWSTELSAVPLGSGTLKPKAVGEYGGVRLSWPQLPAIKSCEVERSAQRDAGWELAAAGLAGSSWFDGHAAPGLTWYYRVRPEIPGATPSESTPAAALEFAVRALDAEGSLAVADVRAVTASGAYAWACCGAGGLRVIDLGDARSPREVGRLDLPDARAVAVAGTMACVADGERGIVVVDISDPRAPRETGARYVQDPRSVAISSNIAYVACGPGGVRLVDVSDPRAPQRLGAVASADAREVRLYAGRLLVADAKAGLRVFDLASPGSPRQIVELPLAGARAVSARGPRAIVLTVAGFAIVDLGDPARAAILATVSEPAACAAVTEEGYAVVAGTSGVQVLDAAAPTGRAIDTVPISGAACMDLADDLACLFDAGSLRLLRLRVLGRPAVLGEAAAAGNAGRMVVDGARAFVAARSSGLLVYEVSAQASHRVFRTAATFNARFAEGVAAAGQVAYVADGASGLRVVSVEAGGRELALFQPGGIVHAVSVSGPLACIAAGPAGALVLDVSNPAVPRQLATIASPDARDVALDRSRLLVADAAAGLRCFDLSNPYGPVEAAPPLASAVRLSAGDGWALALSSEGVALIDWTGVPRIAGFYRTTWAEDACREGDRLLVAEGHRGLTVVDISDPARPRIVSAHRDLYASTVAAGDDYVLIAGAGSVKALKILVPPWLDR